MAKLSPFNLRVWIEEHRHLLKPPVCNAIVWNGDLMVMVAGGPSQRSDFHVNPAEELYYQLEGDIVLRVMENGKSRDIPIMQGDLFLLPAGIPHSPQRPARTAGLVIEATRAANERDHIRWYCDRCGRMLYDHEFHGTDLPKHLKPVTQEFQANEQLRTCKFCGTVLDIHRERVFANIHRY